MENEEKQAVFSGWAKVEVLGHQSHTGFVETQAFGAAVLFRIDRPEIPEEEETLAMPSWIGAQRCPAGTVIKRAAIPAATVLVGSGSIYRIIPCDEATALKAIRSEAQRPLFLVKLGAQPTLASAPAIDEHEAPFEFDNDQDDDEGGV